MEKTIVELAIEQPTLGQLRVSNELKKQGIIISPGRVRSVWLRHDLHTFKLRLKALEAKSAQEGILLSESQLAALEKAKEEKKAQGEIETYHPGYLGAQDTYYVGNIKGVGHIYQQTFIDTYSKIAFTKLYDRKNALVAADLLNDQVVPFFEQHELRLLRILTDRGTDYGIRDQHDYQLYLALEDIDHSKTKAKSPQTNGIVNDSIKRSETNSMLLPSGKRYTLLTCSKTWIAGCNTTTRSVHIPVSIVSEKHHCRLK